MRLGQSSFRRILLSRLLLLSVPVLLMGVYVTYRKARSAFLETARQNLTESAIRKGEIIKQSIDALKTNLASASDTDILKSNFSTNHQDFITQLGEILPTNILCVQLTDLQTNKITATTCSERMKVAPNSWSPQKKQLLTTSDQINIKLLLPSTSLWREAQSVTEDPPQSQLKLWLTAPVYNRQGNLRYALSVKAAILNQERVEPGSLDGYPVVIDQNGVILAHPFIQRVGRNIQQMPDAHRLQSLLRNAIAGKPDFLHLFYLEKDGVELVAGYSSIPSPITHDLEQKWIILAVTPLDAALLPLKDIRQVLFIMTFCLILASSLATLYVSRELARPLEQLRDYALNKEHLHSRDRLPENFQIREFNQLSLALNEMVARLKTWGEEIVSAWKEAQNANQLKSEFLATTSHELRTPLNGIINCIRLVKEGYCDSQEEEIDFLQQADDAAIHLLGIINDVLDISKIEAGKLSVTLEKVDLAKIINEVIDLQTVPIQKKGLKFKTPKWQEEIFVNADPAKLKQILINIVGNAVKFTDYGSIVIDVKIKANSSHLFSQAAHEKLLQSNFENHELFLSELYNPVGSIPEKSLNLNIENNNETELVEEKVFQEKSYLPSQVRQLIEPKIDSFFETPELDHNHYSPPTVEITIQDTGIGIDPNQQEKLFRPFVMVDGSTTRKFGGTGLGLAISRNLIELMGGTISLYSAGEGQGTIVTISIPLAGNSNLEPDSK
ncbi:integral membrane sensor signal transduction histidine kinase [Stanieria cyanosphaera PCC 7437]|uniref:histidine kinase n=1 Tax=Stanieria cyanosphaera (strain ATCC 29371 / PCC 7437) TaxID=111780 RepID=K9XYZ3_STAC7|nr:ATP-binding protein [Stanieria cyanosphaera]AFZ36892.1 integral membrane sensor signal transduction histidine kinase [Stanieria cyanosphaera PCC 7437]